VFEAFRGRDRRTRNQVVVKGRREDFDDALVYYAPEMGEQAALL
jgi:hypothetical protein